MGETITLPHVNTPPWYVFGMPVYYVTGIAQGMRLFKGPIWGDSPDDSKAKAYNKGTSIFGADFEIFETLTISYPDAKAQWKSRELDRTGNVLESLKPIHQTKSIEK